MVNLQSDRHAAPAPTNCDTIFGITEFGQIFLKRGKKRGRAKERGGGGIEWGRQRFASP